MTVVVRPAGQLARDAAIEVSRARLLLGVLDDVRRLRLPPPNLLTLQDYFGVLGGFVGLEYDRD